MAQNTWINISGTWRKVTNVWIKVGGVWKQKVIPKVNIGGVWKTIIQYAKYYFQSGVGELNGITITGTATNPAVSRSSLPNSITQFIGDAYGSGAMTTSLAIDMTNFSKLKAEIRFLVDSSAPASSYRWLFSASTQKSGINTGGTNDVAHKQGTGAITVNTVLELDISALSGSFYPKIGGVVTNDYPDPADQNMTIYLYNLWLE